MRRALNNDFLALRGRTHDLQRIIPTEPLRRLSLQTFSICLDHEDTVISRTDKLHSGVVRMLDPFEFKHSFLDFLSEPLPYLAITATTLEQLANVSFALLSELKRGLLMRAQNTK